MKMLLVDDEVLTLDYLEKVFDWGNLGIQIVGRALDGKEAIEIILRKCPDIILVDIKMPRMDGLELIEWIRLQKLSIKVIILSAFGEFEYAQKALAHGAIGYLLKPVDEAKLEDIINEVIFELNEEEQKEQRLNKLTKMLKESKKVARERILSQLLYPRLDINEVYKSFDQLDINIGHKKYYLFNIFINSLSYEVVSKQTEEYQMYLNEITDLLAQFINEDEGHFVFMNRIGEWIVIYNNDQDDDIKEMVHLLLKRLNNQTKLDIFIAVSHPFHNLHDMSRAYFCTRDIIKYRFYFDNHPIVFSNEVNQTKKIKSIKKMEYEELFLDYIKNGMEKEALAAMNTFFKNIKENKSIEPDYIYSYCLELLIVIKKEIYKDNIRGLNLQTLEDINMLKLREYSTFETLKEYILNIVKDILQARIEYNNNNNTKIIKQAQKYIFENYNSNLTLDEIAYEVDMSKNYFSYLFKRETGIGMWDYLTRVRIEKAKECLQKTNSKVYEVAYEVGYENSSYFNKMFKRHTGMTPREYKMNM